MNKTKVGLDSLAYHHDLVHDSYSSLFFFVNRSERHLDEVVIALVGKYTALEDAYASVLKALNHAALFCHRQLKIRVRLGILWKIIART